MSEKQLWHGFPMEEFTFEGRQAIIAFPKKANAKKSWTIKTEYWDAFPETEIELLNRGFHCAYLKNNNRWATKEDCDAKARFTKFISEKYGLADKCIPVGMSCGGCHAVNFAGYYPECIQCMFIDAPVLNFVDIPASFDRPGNEAMWNNEFVKAYPGIKRADLLNFDNHPINRAHVLIEHKIPILMVYGTDDTVVVYDQNGKLLEEIYEDHPGLLTIIKRVSQGHHPHGFPANPGIIADWIEANA